MSKRVWQWNAFAALSLSLASLLVQAQTVGSLANTTVGNARLIVPDGSSLRQSIGTGETRWFVFGAEPGKTYVVEAVDPDSDLVSGTIGALHVYAANGVTTPPPETNVDCTASTRAPALEVPVAVDGMRCVVRAFPPSPGNTQNKRALYVAVGLVTGPSFEIRVRESTIYGRWTTNGYDFHIELENTTADSMCAEVIFLPNTGDSYAGSWSGGLTTLQLTIPSFGANKLIFPDGTLVGPDNKGTLRIGACPSLVNFVPSGLHVSTYAYNPVTDKFLYFFTTAANNGAASNSWSAASGSGVTSIATGLGLSGGPITTTGTINLAPTNLLPIVACAANQVPQWSGTAWACAAAGGTGTVTSVGTGTGLTGGPITASGTINLAGTQLLPTVACVSNQIPKWNGSAWACAADNNSGGTVTSITAGAGLMGGTITTSGTVAVDPTSSTLTGNFFKQGGNAFGAQAHIGTTDASAFLFLVNGSTALQIYPDPTTPIVIAGSGANTITIGGTSGAAIGGGGAFGTTLLGNPCGSSCANRVTDAFGTIGGGAGNQAGDNAGTGTDRPFATIGGGFNNTASGVGSTVGGGEVNTAAGIYATVAGGAGNSAGGGDATVAGGNGNHAAGVYATVAGGAGNSAAGTYATVAGGGGNGAGGTSTFAAGYRANAKEDGMFVWSDYRNFVFDPTTFRSVGQSVNTFNVRATGIGGVLFVTGIDGSTGAPTWECYTQNGSGWTCTSDRNAKRNLQLVDTGEMLDKVAAMPIYRWQPKEGPNSEIPHVGPMAQDFHATFGLGDNDKAIGMQDAEGVAFAAIQGLNAKVEEQQREISELRNRAIAAESVRGELAALRAELADLRETRTQITARAPAAADSFRADAAR